MPVGPLEIVILLVIVLLIFGPKRLPGLGQSLGRSMREFKDGITGKGSKSAKPKDDKHQESSPPELQSPAEEDTQDAEIVEDLDTDSSSDKII